MKINDKIKVRVPRFVTEEYPLIDVVVDRIKEIRKFSDTEFDLYVPTKAANHYLCRAGSISGLSNSDLDLFDDDRRMFWEKHISKLNEEIVREISTIDSPHWYP